MSRRPPPPFSSPCSPPTLPPLRSGELAMSPPPLRLDAPPPLPPVVRALLLIRTAAAAERGRLRSVRAAQYYPNVASRISMSPYDHKGSLRTTRIQLVSHNTLPALPPPPAPSSLCARPAFGPHSSCGTHSILAGPRRMHFPADPALAAPRFPRRISAPVRSELVAAGWRARPPAHPRPPRK
eukprot:SAG31_NODE_1270_length_9065_cov_7.007473_6_plen_182_part_00